MLAASERIKMSRGRAARRRPPPQDRVRTRRGFGEMLEARRKSSFPAWIIIFLEAPRQRLQVREGDPETNLSIIIRIASLGQGILSVHDFKHRSFSRLIAQSSQAQTVSGKLRGLTEQFELRAQRPGFLIEWRQLGQQAALAEAQFAISLLPLQIRLFYLAGASSPAPDR